MVLFVRVSSAAPLAKFTRRLPVHRPGRPRLPRWVLLLTNETVLLFPVKTGRRLTSGSSYRYRGRYAQLVSWGAPVSGRRHLLRPPRSKVSWALLTIWTTACLTEPELDLPLRVYRNPYESVDWIGDLRLVTQLHDHVGVDTARLREYDNAGYQAVSLLSYSGVPSLSYTAKERLWPAESVLPAAFRASLQELSLFLPGAEEVGFDHFTSPFLTEYIEKQEVGNDTPLTYGSTQEGIDLTNALGGLALLAHPWGRPSTYSAMRRVAGMEIYSAFAAVKEREGDPNLPHGNSTMLTNWDQRLVLDQGVVGVAVNDHYGPYSTLLPPGDPLRDSGKIVVFVSAPSLGNVRAALERGAILAVRDWGKVKGEYPRVESIAVSDTVIHIEANGRIEWIVDGRPYSAGPTFVAPRGANRYVRAQISNEDATTLYTQAFVLRPVGDVNGDYRVDKVDRFLCELGAHGADLGDDTRRACEVSGP